MVQFNPPSPRERSRTLASYQNLVSPEQLVNIEKLAKPLQNKTIQHINSTFVGGGVAEILQSLIPLMKSIGLQAQWDVLTAQSDFFEVTKAFHNAFHGEKIHFREEMIKIYNDTLQRNLSIIDKNADFVILHDQQPLGLVNAKKGQKGHWIWYCHIDPIDVDPRVWNFLSHYARQCDAAIYHLDDYAKHLPHKQFILPPAIDPLSDKNREVTSEESEKVLQSLGISTDRPYVLQVSRYDRLKNPFGLVHAYLELLKVFPCDLIFAGGAADDDPEGLEVYNELKELTKDHSTIQVLNLSPTSHLEINVLQRSAAVVVQNSSREGFGLTVTEAMWKGKAVVSTPVGGIRMQVIPGKTGLMASSVQELTQALLELLQNPSLAQQLGQQAKEHVRQNFITPVYLQRWLELMNDLENKKA
ncbi:glycosyltransferase [Heliorestis convoluta]|uniref:Glycosyl transferases group 1 family protein n=1 Tax=Heliorestis convoluta TaxID=356322 RepID=A0A5Q2N3S1_9FIRM|nr:glycosyltransferase [Heliorestis convoluta]QGG48529.1 glycosyl transferases group 1 family protein [Heliorestis convoluta]